jgi:hypothetical protein
VGLIVNLPLLDVPLGRHLCGLQELCRVPAFLNRTVDFHSILTPWAFLPRGLVTGVVEVDEFLSLQLSLPISTMWLAGDG